MRLGVRPFLGTIPSLDASILPDNNAQTATDCYLMNGALKPAKGLAALGVSLVASTQSVYHYRHGNSGAGSWFQWGSDVNAVASPIADDAYARIYYTGMDKPRYTAIGVATSGGAPYPSASYQIGLPAPTLAALVSSAPTNAPSTALKLQTAYVYTLVDQFGAEGPPGPVSTIVERWDGATVGLDGISVVLGDYQLSSKRIYRLEQGLYRMVGEIPTGTTFFNDSVNSADVGVILPSDTWLAPNPDMIGLTALPNGVMCGFWDNTLAFSEAYRPHAWPIEYRHALEDKIVGLAVSDVGVVVATEGKPVIFVGASPDSMSPIKPDVVSACVSKRSVVDMGSYVAWASEEGLVGNGGVITLSHMTAEQWAALNPSSIHGYRWRDRYLGFYDTGSTQGSFTFHPEEGFLFYSIHADYGYGDPKTGEVFLISGSALHQWHGGASLPYTWRTKKFASGSQDRPGAMRVDASGAVTVKFYGDGTLLKTVSATPRRAFRLPTTARFDQFEVELTGTASVEGLMIASSMGELA